MRRLFPNLFIELGLLKSCVWDQRSERTLYLLWTIELTVPTNLRTLTNTYRSVSFCEGGPIDGDRVKSCQCNIVYGNQIAAAVRGSAIYDS